MLNSRYDCHFCRLLSEELRRLSTGKDTDREKGREKDKEQERQQDRKKEKEQDWLRERQEWEKQEAKLKMNGMGSNGLGPVQGQLVQGQGQALSLVTQMGELSAAVSEFSLLIVHCLTGAVQCAC